MIATAQYHGIPVHVQERIHTFQSRISGTVYANRTVYVWVNDEGVQLDDKFAFTPRAIVAHAIAYRVAYSLIAVGTHISMAA